MMVSFFEWIRQPDEEDKESIVTTATTREIYSSNKTDDNNNIISQNFNELLPLLPLLPPDNINFARDLTSELAAERAAIQAAEQGIPPEWQEAFTEIHRCKCPSEIPERRWAIIRWYAQRIQNDHLHELLDHGWTVSDIFGCHPRAPMGRYDCRGLLLLMSPGEDIYRIDGESITLRHRTGKLTRFYKLRVVNHSQQVMLWNLWRTCVFRR